MLNNLFDGFGKIQTEVEAAAFQAMLLQEGYSGFRRLLDGFTEAVKSAMDTDIAGIEQAVAKASRMFPEPVIFSPSWERIWQELGDTAAYKRSVLEQVPPHDRNGEWQVILDNPGAIQEVVCYPGLQFNDAAYLYAYFRPQLEKAEYIRLQKIQTLIEDKGS
ncbi:hypothetical protein ACFQZT_13485 [Paenibacillus sp. GCM10027628]|uniref:hypothetical protein n=1 Tax=Paenibacillus sp. GCM10027628 TaxID=3273413 RepID=UPI0036368EC6